jgi:hypothetical protein
MTILYYISEDKSDMRGIKPGWYGMEDDGNLSSGPFSSWPPGMPQHRHSGSEWIDPVHVVSTAELKRLSTEIRPALRAAGTEVRAGTRAFEG